MDNFSNSIDDYKRMKDDAFRYLDSGGNNNGLCKDLFNMIESDVSNIVLLKSLKNNYSTLQKLIIDMNEQNVNPDVKIRESNAKFNTQLLLVAKVTYWATYRKYMEHIVSGSEKEGYTEENFFCGCNNEDNIKRQLKKLRFYFHPDHIHEQHCKSLAHSVFVILSNCAQEMIERIQRMYPTVADKLEYYEFEAKKFYESMQDYHAAVKLKQGGDNLDAHRKRLQQKYLDFYVSESQDLLLKERKRFALLACSMFYACLKIYDKLAKTDLSFVRKQINTRKYLAICHHRAGYQLSFIIIIF